MAHREKGYRFPDDWTINEIFDAHKEYSESITVPVWREIESKNTVLSFGQVEEYLKKAIVIVVQDCVCRTEKGFCNSPLDVCLLLDEPAKRRLSDPKRNSREISVTEALDVLKRGNNAGLVLMAYKKEDEDFPKTICSCCSCCCPQLSGLLRFGLQDIVLTRTHVAVNELIICDDCGDCVDRCHFNARKMVDGKLEYDVDKCFGCGICVQSCPSSAIKLEPIKQ